MIAKFSKELSRRFFSNPLLFLLISFLTIYVIYDTYFKATSGSHLIPINIVALLAGVIFESKRITSKWFFVMIIGLVSFFITIAFLNFINNADPHKQGFNVVFNYSIQVWPFIFLVLYFLFSLLFYKYRIIPKLTEGITLLQSIAVIYWAIDYDLITSSNIVMQTFLVIGLLFSLFSIFHAFTHTHLSNTHKLILSVWSSIIMFLFALDNLHVIDEPAPIESTDNILRIVYLALQYFLLGISSIYMIQNFIMLYRFLPRPGKFFNTKYFKTVRQLKDDHIYRYSDEQVAPFHSLVCIIFIGSIFFLNYYYQVVPKQFLIWMSFAIFPFIITLYNRFIRKKNYAYFLFVFLFVLGQNNTVFSQQKTSAENQKYIFFLHNKFIEENPLDVAHPEYGKAEYNEILASYRKDNFIVYSEKRKNGTNAVEYAQKVVKQIKKLLKKGVSPNKITVIGTSKGGYIAQYVSTYLANPDMNFVFIGCFRDIDIEEIPDLNWCGNILTIYEKSDIFGVSAVRRKETSKLKINHFKEVELNTNLKHGFLYKALDEWIVPSKKWANGNYDLN